MDTTIEVIDALSGESLARIESKALGVWFRVNKYEVAEWSGRTVTVTRVNNNQQKEGSK